MRIRDCITVTALSHQLPKKQKMKENKSRQVQKLKTPSLSLPLRAQHALYFTKYQYLGNVAQSQDTLC